MQKICGQNNLRVIFTENSLTSIFFSFSASTGGDEDGVTEPGLSLPEAEA